ncbi:DUF4336 domain-containing protein [Vibrio panuliri]|uniref:DUF4336 domain-containing protein n=1 Tax=Vibrio panuliri TaxID=1381081 RepID=A0A1Q9HEM7_9VIBR|nr:DUF4336 domain-containing protein [Vibrio panuliri]KAB1454674.1 DUF4336 domain-containing protein [Vibrio panuliri]OLQ88169.1 hypothetical protein BIY22_08365 [Vibrio panuliri]OLQ94136.1 hypothetical protein BIY20_07875 [Vibrio panuliri]
MIALADNIWIFNGGNVTFLGFPFSTRMTIVRLANQKLWVHSPIELSAELQQQVESLGEVAYLIAPNHLHHLFIAQWQQAFPTAKTFGTAQVVKKRQDLYFENCLAQSSELPWDEEISHLLFTGSSVMEESVFFHKATQTLIVTDLIENFEPQHFKPLQRNIAKVVGILAPNGKMPLDWRLTFQFNKQTAREHMLTILSWQPQRVILAHGTVIENDAKAFLCRSFSWLGSLEKQS